jgi:lipopolysaccharide biosynthesis protein
VSERPLLVAFYLPQFHPIPENDEWWGKGFTEWTNVTRAVPLFDGHHQPHLPADFGFYDLRLRETRHEQIAVARQYGIDAFCYHYYWFSGRRLLHQPLDDMLADPASDMPFCLCWANENWTRRWDAAEHEVLIAQRYRHEDDLSFIQGLERFFRDSRYLRINGAPLLVVYRPQQLPDPRRTADTWRRWCRDAGLGEIHLCAALTHGNHDYAQFGFDSGVEFPPNDPAVANISQEVPFHAPHSGPVFRYEDVARLYLAGRSPSPNVFRGVFPSWDNTARTGDRSVIFLGSSPDNYEYWLGEAIDRTVRDFPGERRLVFINAWNEWAEGCHLEPDRRFGRAYLEATLRAASGTRRLTGFAPAGDLVATPRRTLLADLSAVFRTHWHYLLARLANWLKRHPRLRSAVRRARGLR